MRHYCVGRLLGVPVYVQPSLALTCIPVGLWTAAGGKHASIWPAPAELALLALLGAVIYCGSIFLHEAGHLAVLRLNGLPVESLTLSALGGRTLAPTEAPGPGTDAAVAAAGPAVTLFLAAAGFALLAVLGDGHEAARTLAGALALMNIALLPGSVIPIWPTDSSRVARAVAWKASGDLAGATRLAVGLGMLIVLVLLELGLLILLAPTVVGEQGIGLILLVAGATFLFQGWGALGALRRPVSGRRP